MTYLHRQSLLAFSVLSLVGAACSSGSPATCSYGGKSYAAGQSFPSTDGCNSCSCSVAGGVACTERACLPDASQVNDAAMDTARADTTPDAAPTEDLAAQDHQPTGETGETGDAGAICPLNDTYTFGWNGGLVAYSDESTLSPPDQYHHTRTYFRADGGTKSCSLTTPGCQVMNSIGLWDIALALHKADVVSAFNEPTPLLYGRDSRPVDGAVYSVARADGHGVLVGDDCGEAGGNCRPIPPGLVVLVDILKKFDQQMLTRAECSGL